jgi:hypothetical protein
MAVERVQVIQRNVDKLVEQITDKDLVRAMENVKVSLQQILAQETEGTGQLADSVQVHRGTQRGKPIVRIITARHGIPFFRGTKAPYGGIPPSPESRFRFLEWARTHHRDPKRLAFVIAKGRSGGKVYQDRTNLLIRAMRTGFRI